MTELDTGAPARGGRMQIPRSRGAASGFLLLLLGVWGALIPFVGPYFDFAYTPDQEWTWTTARGWLEVLPGAATFVGGLLLLTSGNRATAMFGGWLTVLSGAWFVVGRAFAGPLAIGSPGSPVPATETKRLWLELCFFSGLGAVIVFLGALALGRLSVRTLRDIQYTRPMVSRTEPAPAAEPETTATDARTERIADRPADEPATERVGEPAEAPVRHRADAEPKRRPWSGLFRGRHDETTAPR
jgi:hypothetical protein